MKFNSNIIRNANEFCTQVTRSAAFAAAIAEEIYVTSGIKTGMPEQILRETFRAENPLAVFQFSQAVKKGKTRFIIVATKKDKSEGTQIRMATTLAASEGQPWGWNKKDSDRKTPNSCLSFFDLSPETDENGDPIMTETGDVKFKGPRMFLKKNVIEVKILD